MYQRNNYQKQVLKSRFQNTVSSLKNEFKLSNLFICLFVCIGMEVPQHTFGDQKTSRNLISFSTAWNNLGLGAWCKEPFFLGKPRQYKERMY